MKKNLFFVLFCICIVSCGPQNANQQVKTFSTLNGQPTLLIGHRGSPGFGGENTLAGFDRAVNELGADGIELDILLTKDKKLIVGHDYELTRLVGFKQLDDLFPEKVAYPKAPQWYVTDFTLAELQQLKVTFPPGDLKAKYDTKYEQLSDAYRMPSYDEVLDKFVQWMQEKPNLKLYTEIKIDREFVSDEDLQIIADEIIEALTKRNLLSKTENLWLQSFDYGMMDTLAARQELKDLKKTQLEEWKADELEPFSSADAFRAYLQKYILDRGLQMFHSWKLPMRALHEQYKLDFVKIAHEMGIEVHIYTFRDPRFYTDYVKYEEYGLEGFRSAQEELRYFLDMGVDAVMTDYVTKP
jgi:glycerophosphoryl diester phosphodiesterase